MPRDKTQSHIRIVEAARKEFLEYRFTDASLRRIASEAKISEVKQGNAQSAGP